MLQMDPPSLREEEEDRSLYKVPADVQTKYTLLLGEDPSEFVSLLKQLAEQFLPIGPLEEDAVLTIAKGIWRKWRYQRFISSFAEVRRLQPSHAAYSQAIVLDSFLMTLKSTRLGEEDVAKLIDGLPSELAALLNQKCARDNFKTPKAWITRIKVEAVSALMELCRYPIGQAGLMLMSSVVFTKEEVSHELEFEARIDREIERAQERIWRSQARRQAASSKVSRFERPGPRLSEIVT